MKYAPLFIALFVLWTSEARYIGQPGCRDESVWIADTGVDCKYLNTSSLWGLHRKPLYFCTEYPLTRCCDMCRKLGYVKGRGSRQSDKAQSTVKTTVKTTKPPVTRKIVPIEEQPAGCRDERIWLAGSIECKYLIEPSFWGVHKNPKYYCTKYSQTRCCFTCSELGYIKRRTSGLSNKVQSTTKPTVETTISITTNPATEKVGPVQVQPPGANEYVVSVQPLI